MRRPILAGNWKMNMTIAEATDFVRSIRRGLNDVKGVDRVLCPPFTALAAVKDLLQATEIGLGAQNMHWAEKGAYTGELAPAMVKELCQYVILGHSERRAYFGETDEGVNRKIKAALAHGLIPIVCVGETEAQYDAGQTEAGGRRAGARLPGGSQPPSRWPDWSLPTSRCGPSARARRPRRRARARSSA